MTGHSNPHRGFAGFLTVGALMLAVQQHALAPPARAASVHSRCGLAIAGHRAGAATTVLLHRRVVKVIIVNFTFKPAHLVVSGGTHIVWTNDDSDPHTVTSDAGSFTSDALDTGSRYARTFKAPGTFHYHCKIHPFMHGTVMVKG